MSTSAGPAFELADGEITQLVMGYLREKGYFEALSSLQLESGLGEGHMDEELLYLQGLCLQGRWDDTMRYLAPMKRILLHNFEMLEFMVKKQQYLEALSWLGAGGQRHSLMPWRPTLKENGEEEGDNTGDVDMDCLAALLQELESQCSLKEFNHLCTLLTLEKLGDDKSYASWTVAQGRLACFHSLRDALHRVLPGNNDAPIGPRPSSVKGEGDEELDVDVHAAQGLLRRQLELAVLTQYQQANNGAITIPPPLSQLSQGAATAEEEEGLRHLRLSVSLDKGQMVFTSDSAQAGAEDVFEDKDMREKEAILQSQSGHDNRDHNKRQGGQEEEEEEEAFFVLTQSPQRNRQRAQVAEYRSPHRSPVRNSERKEDSNTRLVASPLRPSVQVLLDDKNGIEIHMPNNANTSSTSAALNSPPRPEATIQGTANSRGGSKLPVPNILRRKEWPSERDQADDATADTTYTHSNTVANTTSNAGNHVWTVDVGDGSPVRQRKATQGSSRHGFHDNDDTPSPRRAQAPHSPSNRSEASSVRPSHVSRQAQEARDRERTSQKMEQERAKQREQMRQHRQQHSAEKTKTKGGKEKERDKGLPPPLPSSSVVRTELPPALPSSGASVATYATAATTYTATSTGGYSQRYTETERERAGTEADSIFGDAITESGRTVDDRTYATGGSTLSGPTASGVSVGLGMQGAQERPPVHLASADPPVAVQAAPSSSARGGGYAVDHHGRWLHASTSTTGATWASFQRAPCPLRCIAPVPSQSGAKRDKKDGGRAAEVLVGSNNRSISLLAAPVSALLDGDGNGGRGSVALVEREYCIDYDHPNSLFASGSNDKTVRLGALGPRGLSAPMKGHTGTVRAVKFAPPLGGTAGLNLLASAGAGDCKPRLWDVHTGSSHSVLHGHSAPVHGLLWLDGRTLLSGCEEGNIIAHDLRMSGAAWKFSLDGPVCTLENLPDPNAPADAKHTLAVAGLGGGLVAMFDPRTGAVAACERLHGDDVRAISVLHSPLTTQRGFTGNIRKSAYGGLPPLVTTSFDGTAAVWKCNPNAGRFERLALLQGAHGGDKVLSTCVLRETQQILTAGADGMVAVWTPPPTAH